MNIKQTRRRIFGLQMLAFTVLLSLLNGWAYSLQRTQLLLQMQEQLRTIGRQLTFSVEHEDGQPIFDESIYLAHRQERIELGPHAAAQWLDLEGRVVRNRGSLRLSPRPVHDDLLEFQDQPLPAYVYTLQARANGHPFGYARVAMSLEPVQAQLNRTLASLLAISAFLLLGSGLLSWWWTGRVLGPIQIAHQELSTFAGAVAHELRSPLTALRLNSESISRRWREFPPEELDTALKELSLTSIEMGDLVDDLLLLAQLRRSTSPGGGQPLDLVALLGEIVDSLRDFANSRQVDLSIEVVGSPQFSAEERHLKIILRNLVENAVQYTDSGGYVTVRLEGPSLVVTDSGIGMSEDELAHMCEPFWRAEPSRARHRGGAGLGMAIVLALTNLYCIDLRVESRPREGSRFTLHFPDNTSS